MTDLAAPRLDAGTAALLTLARGAGDFSRVEVAESTGWARTTVRSRIDQLLEVGLLVEVPPAAGLRGRPATRYRFNPDRGRMLVADVGASGARGALCNLNGAIQASSQVHFDVAEGPEPVLSAILNAFDSLLPAKAPARHLWGVAISLPGPVEVATGRVISPPIMRGWNGFDVPARLRGHLGHIPVVVDNDVTAMAWGERQARFPDQDNLIFIKVGTGIGAGLVANGRPLRGAQGAAGDIGHTLADAQDVRPDLPLCRCGKEGCVESYAGGWALARDLKGEGIPAETTADVLRLLDDGHPLAIKLVRDAGRILGASIAEAVSLVNPSAVIIGGNLSRADEHLLSGIRERVALRSLPLATRDLVIEPTRLGDNSGVKGLADLLAGQILTSASS